MYHSPALTILTVIISIDLNLWGRRLIVRGGRRGEKGGSSSIISG
jgi:hypothetical protein